MKIFLKITFSQEKIGCSNEKMLGNGCNRSGHLPVQSQQYKQQNKFKNDTDIRMPVTLFSGVFIVNLDAC